MPTEAFGYTVMTLGEIIQVAQEQIRLQPELEGQPLWIDAGHVSLVFMPTKRVSLEKYGLMVVAERG